MQQVTIAYSHLRLEWLYCNLLLVKSIPHIQLSFGPGFCLIDIRRFNQHDNFFSKSLFITVLVAFISAIFNVYKHIYEYAGTT